MSDLIKIELNVDDAKQLSKVASEIQYIASDVESVFEMLQKGLSLGWLEDAVGRSEIIALSQLCARAMQSVYETEGQILDRFSSKLTDQVKEFGHDT